MHRESLHETPASIPNEEARGWKRITLASLSIYSKTAARGQNCNKNCPNIRYSDEFFDWFHNNLGEHTVLKKKMKTPAQLKEEFSTWPVDDKHRVIHRYHQHLKDQWIFDDRYEQTTKSKPITLYRGIDISLPKKVKSINDIDVDSIFSKPVGIYWSQNKNVSDEYGPLVIEAEVLPKRIYTHTELYGEPCIWEENGTPCECYADEHDEDWDEQIVKENAPINVKALHINGMRYPVDIRVTASRTAAKRITPDDAATVERQMGEAAHAWGWQNEPIPYEDKSEIIHTFDNGWTIREFSTVGDAYREGELMDSCFSNNEYDNANWETPYQGRDDVAQNLRFLSLRDESNIPHASFLWNDQGILTDALGRHNAVLKPAYRQCILDFAHGQAGDFQEFKNYSLDDAPPVAVHTADRQCCSQSKVAADPQKDISQEALNHLWRWDEVDWDSFDDTDFCVGLCGDVADSVTKHMRDGGFDAETIDAYYQGRSRGHHAVTRLGDTIIDWTRRQFDPEAAVPTIESSRSFYKQFTKEPTNRQATGWRSVTAAEQWIEEVEQRRRKRREHFESLMSVEKPVTLYRGVWFGNPETDHEKLTGYDGFGYESMTGWVLRDYDHGRSGIGIHWTPDKEIAKTYGNVVYEAEIHPDHFMSIEEANDMYEWDNLAPYCDQCDDNDEECLVCSGSKPIPNDAFDFEGETLVRPHAPISVKKIHYKSGDDWVEKPFTREVTAAKKLTPKDAEEVERRMGEMAKQYDWQDDDTPYQDQSTIAHTFDNGWTIRELQRHGDAYREGELMSNCFKDRTEAFMFDLCEKDDNLHTDKSCKACGGFGLLDKGVSWNSLTIVDESFLDDYRREKDKNLDERAYAQIYSLRDENNLPHASFSVIKKPDGLVLSDSFGRHNSKPKQEYEEMVNEFVNTYAKSEGHDSFDEYRNWNDEERGLRKRKVAADPQKEEETDGKDMNEQQDAMTAEQQQQMQALQRSNVFNHIVYVHKVDPNAAAELFFQSPVLLDQEHEREHLEGLIDNHLPETLIVAKKASYEPLDDESHELFRHSDCGSWALAHQDEYPHLGLGVLWLDETSPDDDDEYWIPYHAFTHDDENAYDVTGTYPLKDIHLSAQNGCPRCAEGDKGIHTLGRTKITLNHSINDLDALGLFDLETIPSRNWIKKTAPIPKKTSDKKTAAEKKASACSCGSTSFRKVIDPLRTYAKGSKDTYDYECRDCLKMASDDDWDTPQHDYDPSWDYEVDEQPHPDIVQRVEAIRPTLEDAARHAGLGKPQVHFVKLKGKDESFVAKYVSGTSSHPVILIDASKHDLPDDPRSLDEVHMSVLHELGHAIHDSAAGEVWHEPDDEGAVEDYAEDILSGAGIDVAHAHLMNYIEDTLPDAYWQED